MGYHRSYESDDDTRKEYASQNFWPEDVGAHTLYEAADHGHEREIKRRLTLLGRAEGPAHRAQ